MAKSLDTTNDKTSTRSVTSSPRRYFRKVDELTDGYERLLGNHVVPKGRDLLQESAKTRRDGDVESVLRKTFAVLVPESCPPWCVFGRHETLVVGEGLSIGLCEDDHSVLAENASAFAEEEWIIPNLFKAIP